MNVLMTTDTAGGVWNFSLQLCRALEPLGVQVTLAAMGGTPTAAQRAEAGTLGNTILRPGRYRLEWMDHPWEDLGAAGDWLLGLAEELRPDAIHLNGYTHGSLDWPAPVLMTGHSCVLSWWQATRGCAASAEWSRYREAVKRGLRGADLVTAPTAAMLAALQTHYGTLPHAMVVPNGIDCRCGAADPGSVPAAARDPLIIAAGRAWDDAKNSRTIAAAAATIRWPVYFAGSDTGPDGHRRPLHGVRHLGVLSRDQLDAWYARASILVHPALYEPFGLVPLEAALHGCALVLADIPSLREVWADTAVYVDPRDAAALAAVVNRLIDRPAERAKFATAAHRRARRMTAGVMAQEYHAAYRQLAGRTSGKDHELCAS